MLFTASGRIVYLFKYVSQLCRHCSAFWKGGFKYAAWHKCCWAMGCVLMEHLMHYCARQQFTSAYGTSQNERNIFWMFFMRHNTAFTLVLLNVLQGRVCIIQENVSILIFLWGKGKTHIERWVFLDFYAILHSYLAEFFIFSPVGHVCFLKLWQKIW